MDLREQFGATTTALLDERSDMALVYAEISGQYFHGARERHPDRVVNVGIREQLLVSVGGGLALAGIRPVVHTFSTFLVERAFEQVKLDLAHQGVGAVLVGAGGSYDMAPLGRTHQSPGDVALLSTIPGITIHAPSTAEEVDATLRLAAADTGLHYVRVSGLRNSTSHAAGPTLHVVRRGDGPTILALGHVLDDVLAAAGQVDATVLYATQVLPLDEQTLRAYAGQDVVVVEPWHEGTSAHAVSAALADRPHRLLSIGTRHDELRHYGSPREHADAHGLTAPRLAARISAWL